MHIHVGYANPTIETSLAMIRYMDVYLGVPSTLIDPDTRRRELYGKAGCFRLTEYGFEYRVLSGYFLSDIKTLGWVWEQTINAIHTFNRNVIFCEGDCRTFDPEVFLPAQEDVLSAINCNNKECALKIIKEYKINLL